MEEIWKSIKDYEDYEISNLGRIKSYKNNKERLLKPRKDKDGYMKIDLCKDNKKKTHKLHRLVAQAFLANPENKPEVNHKDEDKTNNCASNLQWVTSRENANYGTRNERVANANSIPVVQLDLQGNYINVHQSATQVERELGFYNTHIIKCCKGKLDSAYKFKWQYLKDKEFLTELPICNRKQEILTKQRVFIKHIYSIKERKTNPEREDW